MTYTSRSIATAIAGTIALGPGSVTISAQATIDHENRYASVGVIMVWRVDGAGGQGQGQSNDTSETIE
jgi:hypothetical protein